MDTRTHPPFSLRIVSHPVMVHNGKKNDFLLHIVRGEVGRSTPSGIHRLAHVCNSCSDKTINETRRGKIMKNRHEMT